MDNDGEKRNLFFGHLVVNLELPFHVRAHAVLWSPYTTILRLRIWFPPPQPCGFQIGEILALLGRKTDPPVNVIRLGSNSIHSQWKTTLQGSGFEVSELAIVEVEKFICAHSLVFLGSLASTFSIDIERLRMANKRAHCGDELMCSGEQPWY